MYETRIKKIFDIFTQDKSFVTSKDLSLKLGCSSRTVRDYIKELNKIITQEGAVVESLRGKGFIFKIEDSEKFKEFLSTRWYKYAFEEDEFNNPKLRVNFLMKILLFNQDFIKVDKICEDMMISRSQFNLDLSAVKKILSKYNLNIVSKPYYGVKLEGSEIGKRIAIANCFYKDGKNHGYKNINIEHISEDDMELIKDIFISAFLEFKYEITDVALNNLVVHLAIAIRRIKCDDYMNLEDNKLDTLKEKKEYQIAKYITYELAIIFNVDFPEEEIAYIAIHLLGKKVNKLNAENSISDEVDHLVNNMLSLIKSRTGLDLSYDLDLKISLCLHIIPLIDRILYGLVLKNPLLSEIKKEVYSFDLATIASEVIKEKYDVSISDDEIGYIALHLNVAICKMNEKKKKKKILIVCGSGVGTANLMKYRFLQKFEPYVESLELSNYINTKKLNLDYFDLIITSIPISRKTSTTIIEVGEFLDRKDLESIDNVISNKDLSKFRLIEKDLFFKDVDINSYDDILAYLSKEVSNRRSLKGDLYKSVCDREKMASTILENGIAMPHPIKPLTDKSFVSVCIPKKIIKIGDKKVKIIFMLNIKENEDSEILELFFNRFSSIMDIDKLERLIKANDYYAFIKEFEDRGVI